jgi:hypothetical protein
MKPIMGSSLFGCALVSLVAVAMTFGIFGTARAQDERNTCGVQTFAACIYSPRMGTTLSVVWRNRKPS